MRKIGINYNAVKGLSEEDYITKIAELGFQTCFSGMYDLETQTRLAEIMAKNNIEYENIHAPFGHINDMWADCEGGDAMYNELITCVDHCVAVNAPIMVVHLSSKAAPPPTTDIGRGRYENLVEYAMKKNVKIAFENMRTLANLAWAMETFKDEDAVGFCWDCGHESCYTPGREYMPLFGNRLTCTHIHDNEGELNKDSHLIPFDGQINYERFAEHIRQSGYTGPLTLEVISKNSNHYDQLSPEEYLEKAATAIKRLVSMVDA